MYTCKWFINMVNTLVVYQIKRKRTVWRWLDNWYLYIYKCCKYVVIIIGQSLLPTKSFKMPSTCKLLVLPCTQTDVNCTNYGTLRKMWMFAKICNVYEQKAWEWENNRHRYANTTHKPYLQKRFKTKTKKHVLKMKSKWCFFSSTNDKRQILQ